MGTDRSYSVEQTAACDGVGESETVVSSSLSNVLKNRTFFAVPVAYQLTGMPPRPVEHLVPLNFPPVPDD